MPLNRIRPNNDTNDSLVASTNINGREIKKIADCVDTSNNLLRVDLEDSSGRGLATEAKQDDQITKLTEIDTAVDSIDGKIVKSSDQTPASGTAIECLMYGRDFTFGNLEALRTSSDGKIFVDTSLMAVTNNTLTDGSQVSLIKGNDGNDGSGTDRTILTDGNGALIVDPSKEGIITTDGTTTALHTMMLGNFSGNCRTVKVSSDGSVITAPAGGTIITTDGTTSEQRVMILGNHNGNLRTLACGDGGQLQTEVDHSWDNTNTLINAVPVGAGASTTSSTFDLGQGVSHEIGNVEFFLTNSASLDVQIDPEVSPDGTNWFSIVNAPSVNTNKQFTAFAQEEIGITVGHRYMRFIATNNDGLSSTNITLKVAYYK